MSNRKIYIGKTYLTKMGTEFTVEKIEKGKFNRNSDRRSREPRRAVDKDGNRIKITNILEIKP